MDGFAKQCMQSPNRQHHAFVTPVWFWSATGSRPDTGLNSSPTVTPRNVWGPNTS